MDRGAAAAKLACLLGPLAAAVVALHAFGEGLNRASTRLLTGKKYGIHEYGAFRVIAARGSDYHRFAANALRLFTDAMIRRHGADLGLQAPDPATSRLTIYLLESREDFEERGLTTAHADLANNGGFFQPVKLEIALRVSSPTRDTTADRRALQHEMMHALMHLAAPRAAWSPWLAEGLAEYFENSRPGQEPPLLGGHTEDHAAELREFFAGPDRLSVEDLLGLDAAAFGAETNRAAYRACHLLVSFLLESPAHRDAFLAYYREEMKEGPVPPRAFASIVGDPGEIDRAWRAWLK